MQRRRTTVYIIIATSLLAGFATGRRFFFNVTYAFIGLLVLSFFWAWASANWLELHRQAGARRAQVGRYLAETFVIRNTGFLPKLWMEIYDQSNMPGHQGSHILSNLGPRQSTSWQLNTLCVRRGEFILGPIKVVAGDPFGLFQVDRTINATSRLIVYPAMIDLVLFQMPEGILPGGQAVRRRTYQVTTNAAGVRDYSPGDGFNRIHWPSTARKGRLIVKEFELDPLADVWIIVDTEASVHAGDYDLQDADVSQWYSDSQAAIPPTTEEYAVTIAASLANYFIDKDRAVGLVSYQFHRQAIQADRGARQQTKILEALAVFDAAGTMTFDQVLSLEANQFLRGTTVILVTPSTRESWASSAANLALKGLNVVAVVIDAETFGGRPGHRRLLANLGGANIPGYSIERGSNIQLALGQRAV